MGTNGTNDPSPGEEDRSLLTTAGTVVVLVALPALLAMAAALAGSRADSAYPEARSDVAPVERPALPAPSLPRQATGEAKPSLR